MKEYRLTFRDPKDNTTVTIVAHGDTEKNEVIAQLTGEGFILVTR